MARFLKNNLTGEGSISVSTRGAIAILEGLQAKYEKLHDTQLPNAEKREIAITIATLEFALEVLKG